MRINKYPKTKIRNRMLKTLAFSLLLSAFIPPNTVTLATGNSLDFQYDYSNEKHFIDDDGKTTSTDISKYNASEDEKTDYPIPDKGIYPDDNRSVIHTMGIKNINPQVKLTNDELLKLYTADGFNEPYLANYLNLLGLSNPSRQIETLSTSDLKYKEAVRWLSNNDKLHLPENLNVSIERVALDSAKMQSVGAVAVPRSNAMTDTNGVDKWFATYEKLDTHDDNSSSGSSNSSSSSPTSSSSSSSSYSKTDIYDTTTVKKTLEVIEGNYNFDGVNRSYADDSKGTVDFRHLLYYGLDFTNIYKSQTDTLNTSEFVMNLIKALDKVEYSRPLLMFTDHAKQVGNQQVILNHELAENSEYNQGLAKSGIDYTKNVTLMNYSEFGDRLLFTTPNVKELYLTKALDNGVIGLGDLNPQSPFVAEYLAMKKSFKMLPYSSVCYPVLANYPTNYNPKNLLSATSKSFITPKQYTLDGWNKTFQLVSDFNKKVTSKAIPNIPFSKNYLGSGFTWNSKLIPTHNFQSMLSSALDIDVLLKDPRFDTAIGTGQGYKTTAFENDEPNLKYGTFYELTYQKPNASGSGNQNGNLLANEETTYMNAIRMAYKALTVYSEPTITQLEKDTINTLFGVSLKSYPKEDKEILEYMFAKGILNPEQSVLDLTQPLTNELGIGLIYRIANPNARYTLKNVVTTLDSSMYEKGYSKVNATLGTTSSIPTQPQVVEDTKSTVYVRLEEVFLKDKNGNAYNLNNLNYNPSTYNVDNNLFGIRKDDNSNIASFVPFKSQYYLGSTEIGYTTSQGESRKVIWLKYNLPKDYNDTNYQFNSAGNGYETPSTVYGLSRSEGSLPNLFYVPDATKRSFLGVDKNFNLRTGVTTLPKQKESLTFTPFNYASLNNPQAFSGTMDNTSIDTQDVLALLNQLYPNTYNEFLKTNTDSNSGVGGLLNGLISENTLNSFRFSLTDMFIAYASPTGNPNASKQTSNSDFKQNNLFYYTIPVAKQLKIEDTKLLNVVSAGSGTNINYTSSITNEAKALLAKRNIKLDIAMRGTGSNPQVEIKPTATSDVLTDEQASLIFMRLRGVPTPESGYENVEETYLKYTKQGKTCILISETALSKFNIFAYADANTGSKVLQNTKTNSYAILSESTRTIIMPNEIIHLETDEPLFEKVEDKLFFNFDAIKKLCSYNTLTALNYELNGNNLQFLTYSSTEVASGMKSLSDTTLTLNGKDITTTEPMLNKINENVYLNLNGLGYKAPHLMRTWTEGNNTYTVLVNFYYKDLGEIRSTTTKDYLNFDKVKQTYFNNIYNISNQARINLAFTNLAVHWALYNSNELSKINTITENYISNPLATPKFTLFENGQYKNIEECPQVKTKMLSDFQTLSKLTSLSSEIAKTKDANFNFSIILKDTLTEIELSNHFEVPNANNRYAYDVYKNSILLNLGSTGTPQSFGETKISYNSTDKKLLLNYLPKYIGVSQGITPLMYFKHKSGEPLINHSNTPVFVDDYEIATSINFGALGFNSLIPEPKIWTSAETAFSSNKLKAFLKTVTTPTDNKCRQALYDNWESPFSSYVIKKEDVLNGKTGFGTSPDAVYSFVANSSSTMFSNTRFARDTNKLGIIAMYNQNNSALEFYNYYKSGNKYGAEIAITTSEVESRLKNGEQLYIAYRYPVEGNEYGINTNKQFVQSKASTPYSQRIYPIFDITNTISKNLLNIKQSSNLALDGSQVAEKRYLKSTYLSDLKLGDMVILNEYNKLNDIAVVSSAPLPVEGVTQTYVPVTTIANHDTLTIQKMSYWINYGQLKMFCDTLLGTDIMLDNAKTIPLGELIDKESLQIATASDVKTLMHFLNSLESVIAISETNTGTNSLDRIYNKQKENLLKEIHSSLSTSFLKDSYEIFTYNTETQSLNANNLANKTLTPTEETPQLSRYGGVFTKFDLNPNLQVQWVGDYQYSTTTGTRESFNTRGIYKIVGINVSDSQNISAYSDYSRYLNQDNKKIVKDFWDSIKTPEELLQTDNLASYIISGTPKIDMERQRIDWSTLKIGNFVIVLRQLIPALILLWISLLATSIVFCTMPRIGAVLDKYNVFPILTFGRRKSSKDINVVLDLSFTFLLFVVILLVSQPIFWQLVLKIVSALWQFIGKIASAITSKLLYY